MEYDVRLEMHNIISRGADDKNLLDLSRVEEEIEGLRKRGIFLDGPVMVKQELIDGKESKILLPLSDNPEHPGRTTGRFFNTMVYARCAYGREFLGERKILEMSENMQKELREKDFSFTEIIYAIITIPGGKIVDIYIPYRSKND